MGRLRSLALVGLIASVLPSACDHSGVTAPVAGSIRVIVAGFPPGQRGLSLVVDSETMNFNTYEPNPYMILRGLEPGDHVVQLRGLPSGIPADCRAPDGTDQTVTVVSNVQRFMHFALACTWGTLQITTATNGVEPDSDGYLLQVVDSCVIYYEYEYYEYCGTSEVALPTNGTSIVKITDTMHPRILDATLGGVASNCSASGSQSFHYPDLTSIAFTVTCSPTSASGSSP